MDELKKASQIDPLSVCEPIKNDASVFAENNQLDPGKLRHFAFHNRDAFRQKSIEWLGDHAIRNRFEVLLVWMEFDHREHAELFLNALPNVDLEYRSKIKNELTRHSNWYSLLLEEEVFPGKSEK